MTLSSGQSAPQERLVWQHLNTGELVDGVFALSLQRTAAITSDRLIIVSGGGPQGWALIGIPWKLVAAVDLDAPEPGGLSTVHVTYAQRAGRNEQGAPAMVERAIELLLDLQPDAARMADLANARLASARGTGSLPGRPKASEGASE